MLEQLGLMDGLSVCLSTPSLCYVSILCGHLLRNRWTGGCEIWPRLAAFRYSNLWLNLCTLLFRRLGLWVVYTNWGKMQVSLVWTQHLWSIPARSVGTTVPLQFPIYCCFITFSPSLDLWWGTTTPWWSERSWVQIHCEDGALPTKIVVCSEVYGVDEQNTNRNSLLPKNNTNNTNILRNKILRQFFYQGKNPIYIIHIMWLKTFLLHKLS